jgi:hypothetical protein
MSREYLYVLTYDREDISHSAVYFTKGCSCVCHLLYLTLHDWRVSVTDFRLVRSYGRFSDLFSVSFCLFDRHVSIFAIGIEWQSSGDRLRFDANWLVTGKLIYFIVKKWLILSAILFVATFIFHWRLAIKGYVPIPPFGISEGIRSVYFLTVSSSFIFTLFPVLVSFSRFLFILTYSMEQIPSWEANQSLQLVKNFPAFLWNLKFIYRTQQVPVTCTYPEPTPSSPHNPLQLPEDLS